MQFRHNQHSTLTNFANLNSDVTLTTLEILERRGIPSQYNIVVSCVGPLLEQEIFGDYLPFGEIQAGPYSNILKVVHGLVKNKQRNFIFVFPQRYPTTPHWDLENFTYIELPEFYGTYWRVYNYFQPLEKYNPYNFDLITKHYTCLNKKVITARFLWIHYLVDRGMLNQGNVSFLCEAEGAREIYPDLEHYDYWYSLFNKSIEITSNADYVRSHLPIQTTDNLKIKDNICGSGGWITDSAVFENSFVNIISETYTETPGNTVFTEKIFKTIYHRRPFMVLGSPGALNELKLLGFKTFDRWWDESYDFSTDIMRRSIQVIDELEKITQKSIEDVRNMLCDMQEVLDYNYNHLRELSQRLDIKINQIDRWVINNLK